jgi:hypothetical protein
MMPEILPPPLRSLRVDQAFCRCAWLLQPHHPTQLASTRHCHSSNAPHPLNDQRDSEPAPSAISSEHLTTRRQHLSSRIRTAPKPTSTALVNARFTPPMPGGSPTPDPPTCGPPPFGHSFPDSRATTVLRGTMRILGQSGNLLSSRPVQPRQLSVIFHTVPIDIAPLSRNTYPLSNWVP